MKKKNNTSKAKETVKLCNSTISFETVYPDKNNPDIISDITDVLSLVGVFDGINLENN